MNLNPFDLMRPEQMRPRLRNLDRVELERDGEALIVLYDPLELCEPIALDAEFAPVLDLLAGERSLPQIRQTLLMRGDAPDVSVDDLAAFVADLSDAGMLDDDRFVTRWSRVHDDFLAATHRAPHVAGTWFEAEAQAFARACSERFGAPEQRVAPRGGPATRALWTPAEPLVDVGDILAETLAQLPAPEDLDVIVVFGADRQRGLLPYAVTDKAFDTPLGPVPGAPEIVAGLARELDWVQREQLRLRLGGAIELPCALLRWVYGDACPPVLAVSCAPTSLERGHDEVEAFFEGLEMKLARRQTLLWASGSVSHAGPAYGGTADDLVEQRELDIACIDAALRGAPDTLLRRCLVQPKARASGGATAYALLRLLDPDLEAELSAYALQPAPGQQAGAAGMVGVRWLQKK